MHRTFSVLLACGAAWLLALLLASAGLAQEAAESSPAAVRQYRAAVALQNQGLYELAEEEWKTFLDRFAQEPLADKARHYQGVCQFQQQKYQQAEQTFQQAIRDYPQSELTPSSYVNLGLAQFNQGQAEALRRSVDTFAAMAEKFPEDEQLPVARFYRAEALYSLGEKAQAVEAYRQWVQAHPQHELRAKAIYGLGVALQETGNTAAAGQVYTRFASEFPQDPLATEVSMRQGDVLLSAGKPAEAQQHFAAAANTPAFELADYATLRQAQCLYDLQQFAEAAALYASLLEQFPQSTYAGAATLAAGKSHFMAGNFDQARQWLQRAGSQGGESALDAAHWIARSYLKQSQPAEALQAAEAALVEAGESPLRVPLMLDKADALYETPARRGDSIAAYQALAEQFPEHSLAGEAAYMASFAALQIGQYDRALELAKSFLSNRQQSEFTPDVLQVAAESNLQLGNHQQAADQYARLIEQFNMRSEIDAWRVRQAVALQLAGKHAEVVEVLSGAVEQIEDASARAEALLVLGSSQFDLDQFDAAGESLQASLSAQPMGGGADRTMLLLARTQRAQGKLPEAIATAEQLIERFPNSGTLDQAYFRLGEFHEAAGNAAAAAGAFAHLRDTWPDSSLIPYALLGLGWAQINTDHPGDAAGTLSDLIEKYPQHELIPRGRYARAVARQQTKDFTGALEDIQAYLSTEPRDKARFDALYVRGLCESGLEQYDKAASTFSTIVSDQPEYEALDKVLYELGWCHVELNRAAEAATVFARLVEQHGDSPLAAECAFRVGEIRYDAKEYEQAAENYRIAVEKAAASPVEERALHKLAWSHFQQKQYQQAAEAFRQQLGEYPDANLAADARLMLAESQFQQGMHEEALAGFTAALEGNLSSDQLRGLALLHAGQAAAQMKQWEQSLELLERSTQELPDSDYRDEVLYEQAWARQNLEQHERALDLYQKVADTNQFELGARAQFMAGELMFANKDYQDAVRAYFKVVYGYGYPDSPESYHQWQSDATFEAARCLELLNRPDAAKRLFAELIERFPNSDKLPAAKQKVAALGG
ncbi:MAG: tetratricopeptide repeat protein [Pirellulales bacterium]